MLMARQFQGRQSRLVVAKGEQNGYCALDVVMELLPATIATPLASLSPDIKTSLEEIRLRRGQSLQIRWAKGDSWVTAAGDITGELPQTYQVTANDLSQAIQALTSCSFYALEEELRSG